ncbi:MAG: protein-L-isoaspartate O-methyltransferase [Maritimibacter sp.]|jgi:protein-L-isoaspartate(D-aspartate) O-methyltransferase
MSDFNSLRTMMVDTQIRPSDVTKYPIIEAMLTIPRENFVPDALRGAAYAGAPIELAENRVMFEPRTLAKTLEVLDIRSDDAVLVLGAGLGYSAAVIAHFAEFVVALEEDEALAGEAEKNLSEQGADNVAVLTGALTEGDARHGPYDAIIVEGAVQDVPARLTDQLKDGGRIAVIFAQGDMGALRIGHRIGNRIDWRLAFNAAAPVLPGFQKKAEFVF